MLSESSGKKTKATLIKKDVTLTKTSKKEGNCSIKLAIPLTNKPC